MEDLTTLMKEVHPLLALRAPVLYNPPFYVTADSFKEATEPQLEKWGLGEGAFSILVGLKKLKAKEKTAPYLNFLPGKTVSVKGIP